MTKATKITDGAMLTAIFAVLILINKYTAGAFLDLIIYILPIPMTAFSVKYGHKNSLPVFLAMIATSAFLGNMTGIFYAISSALIGLVLGGCIYSKVDGTKTLFLIMLLSALMSVFNTVILASIFSYDFNGQLMQMQQMLTETLTASGMPIPESMLALNYMLRMLVISAALAGVIQGLLTYYIGLAILKKLRFSVEKPKSIFEYYPNKFTSYVALLGFCVYMLTGALNTDGDIYMTIVQTLGMCAVVYLMAFGFICLLLFVRVYTDNKLLAVIGAFLVAVIAVPFCVILGYLYIAGNLHTQLLEAYYHRKQLKNYKG